MDETDGLRPLLLGGRFIGLSELLGALVGQRGLERMTGRPPHFRREVVAVLAEGLYGDREQDGLADRCSLRLEPLLQCLLPERGEVGWDHHAGDDLARGVLEGGDLGREVVRQVLVAAGVGELVALRRQDRREAHLLVAPRVAVAVVGEQGTHGLVGRRPGSTCW